GVNGSVTHQFDPRVVRRDTPRTRLQPVAVDGITGTVEPAHDASEFGAAAIVIDGGPVRGELFRGGAEHPTRDPQTRSVDLDVVPDALRDGHEPALVGLVRQLVLAEPHVPVGPESLADTELLLEFG